MNRRIWLWVALLAVPVALAGVVYASHSHRALSFTCPLTGKELPCCPCSETKEPEASSDSDVPCCTDAK